MCFYFIKYILLFSCIGTWGIYSEAHIRGLSSLFKCQLIDTGLHSLEKLIDFNPYQGINTTSYDSLEEHSISKPYPKGTNTTCGGFPYWDLEPETFFEKGLCQILLNNKKVLCNLALLKNKLLNLYSNIFKKNAVPYKHHTILILSPK